MTVYENMKKTKAPFKLIFKKMLNINEAEFPMEYANKYIVIRRS